MRECLGRRGMSPTQFWGLTLPELKMILSDRDGASSLGAPPTRADLETLLARFPDDGIALDGAKTGDAL